MSMIGRLSGRAAVVAVLAFIVAACGGESGDSAADGLSSSGRSLGAAGAHEHGIARVNVAVENEGAVIEFFAPGQSIYGFEGEPRGAEQEAARAAGIERLKRELPRMFAFDPSLDCRFGPPRVELEDEDHAADEASTAGEASEHGDHEGAHEDETHDAEAHDPAHASEHVGAEDRHDDDQHDDDQHDEVHAEVEVRCARSPAGTDLRLAVTESLPEIVQVDLQVLSAAQQSGARVAASGHTVRL